MARTRPTSWNALLLYAVMLGTTPAGCAPRGLEPGEGFVDVTGGRVWYRIAGGGTATPLLLLHGGPGAPSYYLNPLEALSDERPIIFYDHLGAGRSDRPDRPELWTVARFVEELGQVREALHLDEVHILGHSWGTMLATEYMSTSPAGVRSLVLASPAISVSRWLADATELKAELPPEMQQAIAKSEADGTFESPEYQAAVMEFYRRYLCRVDPWPADVTKTFEELGTVVYNTMWGPSEFTATGTLRSFDRTDQLGRLDLPVLFTTGRYDEARPETVEYYRSLVRGARLQIFERSAHLTMQDEPGPYVDAVRAFLREVDGRR